MNVQEAWEQGYTGRGIVVSILDDGIERDHPDLKENYVRNEGNWSLRIFQNISKHCRYIDMIELSYTEHPE